MEIDTTYHLHDDAQVGPELELAVSTDSFAYGVELQLKRGDKQANIVLDYFAGELIVRQYSLDGDYELGHLSIIFSLPKE